MNVAVNPTWRRLIPSIGSLHANHIQAKTLYALAALLFLVKVPHLPHLPLWVSAAGFLLVGARLTLLRSPTHQALRAVLSPLSVTFMAAASAFFIKWHYGYFVGRDPCVAFLFILVAAKFAEVRRASDATLLLCLCAFLLLTQYFYSQSIISAVLTLPAVLALGYSLSALRDASNPETTSSQIKLVGVMLVQGLPLAALLFIVFPRLPGPLWSLPEDSTASTGLSGSMSPGSIGELSQSDAVAFRVEFDDVVPKPEQLYWRGPVLTEFDGRNWEVSRFKFETTPSYTGPSSEVVNYVVTLQPHRLRWLFALENASALPSSYNAAEDTDRRYSRTIGKMNHDGQILAEDNVTQTLRYRQSSVLSRSFPAIGRPHQDTMYLPGRNMRTIRFARQLRSEHDSDRAYANAVMGHFNKEPFHYTLQPQLLGDAPVDEFLFESREGFCEHYASAFVVMMRAAGVPARVVTGYQGGEMNEDYMIVRQSDAHAWTEAFLDGAWQRFDPTGAVAPSRVERGLAAALPNESSVPRLARMAPGILRDMQMRWDAINHNWQRLVIDFDNDSQASFWARTGLGKPALWQIVLVIIVVAGVWSALILAMPSRALQNISAQERCWQQLSRLLHTRMTARRPNETPSEYLQRAAMLWPTHQPRFERLDADFASLRFMKLEDTEHKVLLSGMKRDILYLQFILPFSRRLRTAFAQTAVRQSREG